MSPTRTPARRAAHHDARARDAHTNFQWSKDGKKIQTVLLPDDGKREMPKREAGTEPKVRVTRGGANPSRTYRFLLESPYDMVLLEYLATGQVAVVDVADGKVTKIGGPAMVRSVSMAPNEESFRVTAMKKPFSYYVPMVRFGQTEGIWNNEGKSLYTILDRNLRETDIAAPMRTAQAGPGGGATAAKRQRSRAARPRRDRSESAADRSDAGSAAPARSKSAARPDAAAAH